MFSCEFCSKPRECTLVKAQLKASGLSAAWRNISLLRFIPCFVALLCMGLPRLA